YDFDTKGTFTRHLVDLLGEPRRRDDPMTQRHYDIAAGLQEGTEAYLMTALKWLRRQTGSNRLGLTGGGLMKSAFYGKLAQSGLVDEVFIPYAPDDSGNSIGAALWVARRAGETGPRAAGAASPFLGREYSDDEIGATLERYHLTFRKPNDVAATTAEFLASGKVVGWFQGRMEFGQRALGGRSILADPRDAGMKDRINAAVKYREAVPPFAAAILAQAPPRAL